MDAKELPNRHLLVPAGAEGAGGIIADGMREILTGSE
jgi:hypothetical protein